ncbi:hypothetical protein LMG28138_00446 [Pararobbsia alpina]|uniref:Tyr recombinase domain-containing protein n=1 Tax=Pararobbsia alpina TaxID=621374 RepID=A0A6S7B321_9BURK|nr:hypothetical protein LMG28138_00446 [Pararobbsia alpina]
MRTTGSLISVSLAHRDVYIGHTRNGRDRHGKMNPTHNPCVECSGSRHRSDHPERSHHRGSGSAAAKRIGPRHPDSAATSARRLNCEPCGRLKVWFAGVRAIANQVIGAYLQGLLITGAQREELAALRWDDVDFRWRSLVLDDKVEGTGGRTISLTPYLASLLLNLKRLNETPTNKRQAARLAEKGEQWSPSPKQDRRGGQDRSASDRA